MVFCYSSQNWFRHQSSFYSYFSIDAVHVINKPLNSENSFSGLLLLDTLEIFNKGDYSLHLAFSSLISIHYIYSVLFGDSLCIAMSLF